MSSPEKVVERSDFRTITEEMNALHDKKREDYGLDADPLYNVRQTSDFNVVPWLGAILRANDKMTRLKRYATRGTLSNESMEDSLLDLANYAVIALILWRQDKTITDELPSFHDAQAIRSKENEQCTSEVYAAEAEAGYPAKDFPSRGEPPIAEERTEGNYLVFSVLERAELIGHCECPLHGCFHRNQSNHLKRPNYCVEKQKLQRDIADNPSQMVSTEICRCPACGAEVQPGQIHGCKELQNFKFPDPRQARIDELSTALRESKRWNNKAFDKIKLLAKERNQTCAERDRLQERIEWLSSRNNLFNELTEANEHIASLQKKLEVSRLSLSTPASLAAWLETQQRDRKAFNRHVGPLAERDHTRLTEDGWDAAFEHLIETILKSPLDSPANSR